MKWRNFSSRNLKKKNMWLKNFLKIKNSQEFKMYFNYELPTEIMKKINDFKSHHFMQKTKCATRKSSEMSLDLLTPNIQNLIGGSADLTGSNNTKTKEQKPIIKNDFSGKYIYYGVREHAMAGIYEWISFT